jgi:hypothetical protein
LKNYGGTNRNRTDDLLNCHSRSSGQVVGKGFRIFLESFCHQRSYGAQAGASVSTP